MQPAELEVLAAAAGRDVNDAGSLVHRHVLPRDDAVLDLGAWRQVVEGAPVAPPDELAPRHALDEDVLGEELHRDPFAAFTTAVFLVGMHRGGDVGRQRPRCRRPDDERLAGALEQRQADEQRGVGPVLVDAGLRQLVLRQRRTATRAPLGRPVALHEPAARVHELEELPDVLDVRVAEREVVVAPVHPLPEALRAARQGRRRPDDDVAALPGERLEAVLLDLGLRVQPELALDADFDPEPLAVEAVLVALLEAAKPLVALEDVLERPSPRGVDTERGPVRGHRTVDERPPRAAAVELTQLRERPFPLPDVEELEFERRMVRFVGEPGEHGSIVARCSPGTFPPTCAFEIVYVPSERNRWQPTQRPIRSRPRS